MRATVISYRIGGLAISRPTGGDTAALLKRRTNSRAETMRDAAARARIIGMANT